MKSINAGVPALVFFLASAALSCMAAITCDGNLSYKATIKSHTVDLDTTVDLSVSADDWEITSTWKADEDGFSSLKIVGEHPLMHEIEGRGEAVFDEERLKTLKLKSNNISLSDLLGKQDDDRASPSANIETYFKGSSRLS
jgi:hypothetical protein